MPAGGTTEATGDGVRVLVVDDDPAVATLTREFLDREERVSGVVAETDPEAALETLESDPDLDCVVSDFKMPGMDGLEFFQKVRGTRPSMSFVLFTGSPKRSLTGRAPVEKMDGLVIKGGESGRYDELVSEVFAAVESAG